MMPRRSRASAFAAALILSSCSGESGPATSAEPHGDAAAHGGAGGAISGGGGNSPLKDGDVWWIPCTSDDQCNPVHPICQDGRCMGCQKTEHCNDAKLACDTTTRLCATVCADSTACKPPTPYCEPSLGFCVQCANGADCPAGLECAAGHCLCPSGQTICGVRCVDAANDPTNCGSCGRTCRAEEACIQGVCHCRPGIASSCDLCIDGQSDPRCCGTRTTICPAGATRCEQGQCISTACTAGLTECAVASGTGCVDITKNNLHCGGCGRGCPTNQICVAGTCQTYTPALGCVSCPCVASCEPTGGACCTVGGFAFCVAGGNCPG